MKPCLFVFIGRCNASYGKEIFLENNICCRVIQFIGQVLGHSKKNDLCNSMIKYMKPCNGSKLQRRFTQVGLFYPIYFSKTYCHYILI